MQLLKSTIHSNVIPNGTSFHRQAARAIVLKGDNILLLYTARYDDYTLPGGGIDEGEDLIDGLVRELREETGAKNIANIEPFGRYEEFRPWYKGDFDIIHMESFCYTCTIDHELGATELEDYEQQNGMRPVWVDINDAIKHNERTMLTSDKQGMSIIRETFLLKLITQRLLYREVDSPLLCDS